MQKIINYKVLRPLDRASNGFIHINSGRFSRIRYARLKRLKKVKYMVLSWIIFWSKKYYLKWKTERYLYPLLFSLYFAYNCGLSKFFCTIHYFSFFHILLFFRSWMEAIATSVSLFHSCYRFFSPSKSTFLLRLNV